jgi:hypothetical protein
VTTGTMIERGGPSTARRSAHRTAESSEMTEPQDTVDTNRKGDRRGNDRRADDRRRSDRRNPPPPWRQPWAFVAYGVLAALVVFLLIPSGGADRAAEHQRAEVIDAPAVADVDRSTPAGADAPPVDAYGPADFERLLAEGDLAAGRRVNARLFCGGITAVALRSVPKVPGSVAALADSDGRVPAAECKWGAATAAPDFLLLVPAPLAERFAAAPEVEQGFVRRRRVDAEVEWVGRSDAMALRTTGVLRELR